MRRSNFILLSFLVWLGAIYGQIFFNFETPPRSPASRPSKRIIIAINGLGSGAFEEAQNHLKLFQGFTDIQEYVLPFPSVNDYAWNEVTHSRVIHGASGRLGSYEAIHFDRDSNQLKSDPRNHFRRLGKPQYYFHGFFEHVLNPFVPILDKPAPGKLARLELERIKEQIIQDPEELSVGMIRFTQTGPRYLRDLDNFLSGLQRHYERTGISLELSLVSTPGMPSSSAIPVELGPLLEELRLRSKAKLKHSADVVVPRGAAGSFGQVYFRDLEKRWPLIERLQKEPWFEHAFVKKTSANGTLIITIFDQAGHGELSVLRDGESLSYLYAPVTSNPLIIPPQNHNVIISDLEARELLAGGAFPDAFYRIAQSALQEECDFPDLLFTLKEGFLLPGETTQGSLSKAASLGFVASTGPLGSRSLSLRSSEVLQHLGVTAQELRTRGAATTPKRRILTGKENQTFRRKIELMHRVVHYSSYLYDYLDEETMGRLLKPLAGESEAESPRVSARLTLTDFLKVAGALVRSKNSATRDRSYARVRGQLDEYRAEKNQGLIESVRPHSNGLKKSVMKAFTSPYFLRKAYQRPKTGSIPDLRRLVSSESPQELFQEVFKERKIQEDIAPEKLSLIYKPNLRALEGVTLVFVPGIYNTIFENEIFGMGLRALTEKFGLRVISPEVFSLCSSDFNAPLIMDFIKQDRRKRINLGYRAPKYFVLGYSKGGVDTLHAFASDPEFVRSHVLGMLALASPLQGTSILDKTDLPFDLVRLLGTEHPPAECKNKFKASESITTEGARKFLESNYQTLAGLTKYYSLSFTQKINRSHVFMQVAKHIGQFKEPNDGVVPLSATRFPKSIPALDLGVVEADHLAGIMASEFPQEAFMEALVITLLELNATDRTNPGQ